MGDRLRYQGYMNKRSERRRLIEATVPPNLLIPTTTPSQGNSHRNVLDFDAPCRDVVYQKSPLSRDPGTGERVVRDATPHRAKVAFSHTCAPYAVARAGEPHAWDGIILLGWLFWGLGLFLSFSSLAPSPPLTSNIPTYVCGCYAYPDDRHCFRLILFWDEADFFNWSICSSTY
ncbi:hypothetical protein F4814DRAFT_200791 [Daldinia grandis]|nr:hypothetical protein F4814DRAFT_200791 [Daldinia grandis]